MSYLDQKIVNEVRSIRRHVAPGPSLSTEEKKELKLLHGRLKQSKGKPFADKGKSYGTKLTVEEVPAVSKELEHKNPVHSSSTETKGVQKIGKGTLKAEPTTGAQVFLSPVTCSRPISKVKSLMVVGNVESTFYEEITDLSKDGGGSLILRTHSEPMFDPGGIEVPEAKKRSKSM